MNVQCRKPDQSSWSAFSARYDSDKIPKSTTMEPAWRTTAPGIPLLAFYLSEDTATGKPYMLTLAGARADGTELETEFYLE